MKILALLLSFQLLLWGVEPSLELQQAAKSVQKDSDLKKYVLDFPYQNYKKVYVPGLGDFFLDEIQDNIKDQMKRGIYWEGGIGQILIYYTRPGTIGVDVGSHIGIHTLTMSRCVGPNGLVVSFEPQKKLFREQHHNLRLNGCSENVIQLPFCLGEREQDVEIVSWQGQGVNEGGAFVGIGGQKAHMVFLDSLQLDHVSCMKIDVECYELEVLMGAEETIKKNRPVIVLEILGNHDLDTCTGEVRTKFQSTLNFLHSLGYFAERIANTNDFVAYPQ